MNKKAVKGKSDTTYVKKYKELLIPFADAVVDPGTVMVHFANTTAATATQIKMMTMLRIFFADMVQKSLGLEDIEVDESKIPRTPRVRDPKGGRQDGLYNNK